MPPPSIDNEFLSFREHGDAEALGRVFDAAAPALLCVATQLAPNDAEDLVQLTFVRAIEKAATWDASRPLRPWLVGILALEARELRRRHARSPDPERVATDRADLDAAPGPDALAESVETADRVAAALDELPDGFRQVCILRLVHGLEPVQIARALGVPQSTVRTRLHRGLQRLRAALPASLAGALTVALLGTAASATTLAVARAAVVEVARTAAPQLAGAGMGAGTAWGASVTVGATAMKKTITLAVLVLVAVSYPIASLFSGAGAAPVPPDSAAPRQVADAADATNSTASGKATGDEGLRAPVDPAGNVTPPARPAAAPVIGPGTAFGRVIDARGVPVADCSVIWRRLDPERRPFKAREFDGRTGADGRFVVAFDGDGEFELCLGSWEFGYAVLPPRACIATDRVDLGDIRLRELGVVSGRLTMRDGTPLAHWEIDIRHREEKQLQLISMLPYPSIKDGAVQPVRHCNTETDAEGAFRFAVLEPGEYLLRVRQMGWYEEEFAVSTADPDRGFVLAGQLATVRVVGENGQPMAVEVIGAEVSVSTEMEGVHEAPDALLSEERSISWAGVVDQRTGSKRFLLPRGAHFVPHVSRASADRVAAEVEHRVAPDVATARLDLVQRRASELGTIAMRVFDQFGNRIENCHAHLLLPVSLGHAGPGWDAESAANGNGTWEVPAGSWIVELSGGPEHMSIGSLVATRQPVVVTAGQRTDLRFDVARHGWVRVQLSSAEPPAEEWRELEISFSANGREVAVPVITVDQGQGAWITRRRRCPVGLPFSLRQPIPAGSIALTIRAAGYAAVTRRLVVQPEEVTRVTFELRASSAKGAAVRPSSTSGTGVGVEIGR